MDTSSLLKDIYSPAFYDSFTDVLVQTLPTLQKQDFIAQIFTPAFQQLELKDRMRHTAQVLHQFLPADFEQGARILLALLQNLEKAGIKEKVVEFMFLPEYVAMFGLEHYDTAVSAMEVITQFTSCEFAVRPFLLKYEEKMIAQMLQWSLHTHKKVRRLASEGIRPSLPWGMVVPTLKKKPELILPILENLKQDSCEVVRRSVANNLNDISKDHPQVVVTVAQNWRGLSAETDALIKHACRTLLKRGNTDILRYYGLDGSTVEFKNFQVHTPQVRVGEALEFSFTIANLADEPRVIRLEYGVYYLRNNGSLSKKVFKISEKTFQPKEKIAIQRKQSFRIITTKRFYVGEHQISLIINGIEKAIQTFDLLP